MKHLLFAMMALASTTTAYALKFPQMPIMDRPPSCIAATLISPVFGTKRVRSRNGDSYINSYDRLYRKTESEIKNILKDKGYILAEELGCGGDGDLPDGVVYSACFGSSDYYLTISAGFTYKHTFFTKSHPYSYSVSVSKNGRSDENGYNINTDVGYYFEVPETKVPRRQSNLYYDKLLKNAVAKIPNCEDLKLIRIKKEN